MFTLLANRKQLRKVIDKMEAFWILDNYGEAVKQEVEAIYSSAKKNAKSMLVFAMCVLPCYVIFPLLGKTKKLPFRTYFPTDLNQSPQYELAYVEEIFTILVALISILGSDGLFISLIVNVICELKIIKHSLKNIRLHSQRKFERNEGLLEYHRIIDHHNLVLSCIKNIRNIYSTLLLFVYFLSMSCICGGLLGIIASGFPPTLPDMSKYGGFTIFSIMQLFFYCVTGHYLITESESISYAVYETDWWIKTQPEYRRACMMIIQRCNKKEELTAGGMFSLNLDSFRKVIRAALSFFTLLEAVYVDN